MTKDGKIWTCFWVGLPVWSIYGQNCCLNTTPTYKKGDQYTFVELATVHSVLRLLYLCYIKLNYFFKRDYIFWGMSTNSKELVVQFLCPKRVRLKRLYDFQQVFLIDICTELTLAIMRHWWKIPQTD